MAELERKHSNAVFEVIMIQTRWATGSETQLKVLQVNTVEAHRKTKFRLRVGDKSQL